MTTIQIEIEGLAQLTAQLQALGLAGDEVIEDVIFDVLTDTHAFAIQGIQGGPKTGTTYYRIPGESYMTIRAGSPDGPPVAFVPGGGSHNLSLQHTASAPGQYPATDTGRLVSSVRIEHPTPLDGRVGTNMEYGPMLEFGTSRMAARPWLLPSFERARIGVENELRARLEAKL